MEKPSNTDKDQLPDGTVTFLFTDIEGSTRLWDRFPQEMRHALAQHDTIIRSTIQEHDGVLIKSTGDGVHAAFQFPRKAVEAALEVQRALQGTAWSEETGRLRVRMGLHTATAELRDGDYFGPAVNRAARLMAAGHGDQILVSPAVLELIRDELPDDVHLLDLGLHRLRSLSRPERIYQLTAPDLPTEFPKLKTVEKQVSNLPETTTEFIGRDEEIRDVIRLLTRESARLVTITGPGGIGKTRLVLRVASKMLEEKSYSFTDGVVFVDLVPLDNPALIIPAIASQLDVGESGSTSLIESLKRYLNNKSILLLLDNLEHVIEGVEVLSDLLRAGPDLKILTTSREALNLYEEWLYPLDGLSYPTDSSTNNLTEYGAVQLFYKNAQRIQPNFNLSENKEGVIEICQLVEGMPLAIELAASWVISLTTSQIAEEIKKNYEFLESRMRNLPARHRSMRAAFDYSWQQLSPNEAEGFSRLSVFRGGFTRDAAQSVASASLGALTTLRDRSLLQWNSEHDRFRVHELLRQFAEEQLKRDSGDWQSVHDAHCEYFSEYSWKRTAISRRSQAHETIRELEKEAENIFASWRWAISKQMIREIRRIIPAIDILLTNRSQYIRGLVEFEEALAILRSAEPQDKTELTIAATLIVISWFHIRLGQLDDAEKAIDLSREIYDRLEMSSMRPGQLIDPDFPSGIIASIRGDYSKLKQYGMDALNRAERLERNLNREFSYYLLLRSAVATGQYQLALEYFEKMSEMALDTEDRWLLAYGLLEKGNAYYGLGDLELAEEFFREAYSIREKYEDPEGMAVALNHLGKLALRREKYHKAGRLFEQSQSIYERIGDRGGLATSSNGLARAAVALGEFSGAKDQFRDALSVATDIQFIPMVLAILAGIGEFYLKTGLIGEGRALLETVWQNQAAEHEIQQLAETILMKYKFKVPENASQIAVSEKSITELNHLVQRILTQLEQLDIRNLQAPAARSGKDRLGPDNLID